MSEQRTIRDFSRHSSRQGGPNIQFELSLRSEVGAISPFVETVMHLIRKCQWLPGIEEDVEIALLEALANALVHGNHKDPGMRVYVGCLCGTGAVVYVIRVAGHD